MAKKLNHLINSSKYGFALIEVMIALVIFASFIAAFSLAQSHNIASSQKLREELYLKDLCQNKINDILNNPPELNLGLTLTPNVEALDYDDREYQFTTIYKEFKIPDISKIKGNDEEEEVTDSSGIQTRLEKGIKDNLEKLIWQVNVLIENKVSGQKFELSSWIYNIKADINLNNL